jgi:hypothetical protein
LILLAFLFAGISKKIKENQSFGELIGEQILRSNFVHRILVKTAPVLRFRDCNLLIILSFLVKSRSIYQNLCRG